MRMCSNPTMNWALKANFRDWLSAFMASDVALKYEVA
jgi:hypothetical protein